jgi:phosphoenolpyruvate carboxykinase (GTP)
MGQRLSRPPLIFGVNWFRRDAGGNLLWPGFGENIRVLSWIIARCEGQVPAQESPIGWLPRREDFDLAGLADFSEERLEQLLAVHRPDWQAELGAQQDFFQLLGSRLPAELAAQCDRLQARLAAAALATMANPG